ncbi:MAG TPA: SDR family oxidoreductase [Arenibacter sp.]|nr:SDR family oxidoreductase [Arenibacter sp.]
MATNNSKVIWITGASSGLGEALAYELAHKGHKLIISSRKQTELERVRNNCPDNGDIAVLPLDLVAFDTMPQKVIAAIALHGPIDILINNAGISQRSLILETDMGVYQKLMDVNYLGTIALTKAVLPYFIARKKGHFVTVTSLMGKFGSPYRSGYCAAKHALHGFFDVLRMEHAKDNVAVTLVCPGFVDTNVAKNALTADGSPQAQNDAATENGLSPRIFAKKMVKAIAHQKFEVYIGKKEIMGVYLKRFFPKLLHRIVLKSKVR